MKTFLITGASKGIGRATVEHLAARGHRVYAGVRTPGDAPKLQGVFEVILDVTKAEQIDKVREIIEKAGDGLDGLVNNAGLVVPAPLEYLPIHEFRRQIEVNLTGQLMVTQAVLPMLKAARGRIVMMSSVAGRLASGLLGAYHASKFALEALADTLRVELRPWGVKTLIIEPGAIATPIWETAMSLMDHYAAQGNSQALEDYSGPIKKKRQFAQKSAVRGLPPKRVALAVEKALINPRPRGRYIVGIDSWLGIRILSWLPPIFKDPLIATQMR